MLPRTVLIRQPASSDKQDFAKSRTVVLLDLSAKVIGAVAAVILGAAGLRFQQTAESHRRNLDAVQQARQTAEREEAAVEREQRVYLPTFRGLVEVESLLDRAASEIRKSRNAEIDPNALYDIGSELRYAAYGLILPDGDVQVSIRPLGMYGRGDVAPVRVGLRSSLLMLADALRFEGAFHDDWQHAEWVELSGDRVLLRLDRGIADALQLSVDALPSWRAWFYRSRLPLTLYRRGGTIRLLDDLHFGTAEAARALLLAHRQLGDKYVEIRVTAFPLQQMGKPAQSPQNH
jgi:hypothetical protein